MGPLYEGGRTIVHSYPSYIHTHLIRSHLRPSKATPTLLNVLLYSTVKKLRKKHGIIELAVAHSEHEDAGKCCFSIWFHL
jgi:hypothetical protein